jgi:hypothetical protein
MFQKLLSLFSGSCDSVQCQYTHGPKPVHKKKQSAKSKKNEKPHAKK